MDYYIFNIKLKEKIFFPLISIKLNQIILRNEDGEKIIIKDRIIFIEDTDRLNQYLLYVEEDSNNQSKLQYLMDEDFEIILFDVEFINIKTKEVLTLIKWDPLLNQTKENIYSNFLEDIFSKRYMDTTLCIEGNTTKLNKPYYTKNTFNTEVINMAKFIEEQMLINNLTHIMNGSNIGFDIIGFHAVDYLKKNGYPNLKNILVFPFKDFTKKWKNKDLIKLADYVFMADEIPGYNINLVPMGKYHKLKNNKKVFFMIDYSKFYLSDWNNSCDEIETYVSYAIKKDRKCLFIKNN